MNLRSIPAGLFSSRDPGVLDQIMAPAELILDNYIRGVYRDGPFDDARFLRAGVQRVLSQSVSGRDFLQLTAEVLNAPITRSSFFDSLHSSRRCRLLDELNHQLVEREQPGMVDLLAGFPELKDRPIHAVDGHHLAHAVHSPADEQEEYVSSNSLYVLCLHSGLLEHLGNVQGDGQRHHEMPPHRTHLPRWLGRRTGGSKARRAIQVCDPAYIDKAFWTRMVLAGKRGVDLITRAKSGMKPQIVGTQKWDPVHVANQGVLGDQLVRFEGSCLMRLILYEDVESGTVYEFLTTVMDLAPGLIALIYLLRWRIEKVFDTGKNKLEETKGWASGEVAQQIQGHFFALTHNLLMLLRTHLELKEGIREEKIVEKRGHSLKDRQKRADWLVRKVAIIQHLPPAVVQLTAQFIRAVRNGIMTRATWLDSLPSLRAAMVAYL